MSPQTSFFTYADGVYAPTELAQGGWSADMISGPAVVGALAQSLESHHGDQLFQPARLTVDLFAPVRFEPLKARAMTIREGNRIRVADAELLQGNTDTVVARATLVQLRRGEQPPGEVWRPARTVTPPPRHATEQLAARQPALFNSDLSRAHWTASKSDHQNAGRKSCWRHPYDVVEGRSATPFQKAAVAAEVTSLLTNWGDKGIGFINADLTLALSRLPEGDALGIEADAHISDAGVAVGSATLFDRRGAFGTGVVIALGNSKRQISYTDA